MNCDSDPIEARTFDSFDAMMQWLRCPEQVQALLDEFPPELYRHHLCVNGTKARVLARRREGSSKITYH